MWEDLEAEDGWRGVFWDDKPVFWGEEAVVAGGLTGSFGDEAFFGGIWWRGFVVFSVNLRFY